MRHTKLYAGVLIALCAAALPQTAGAESYEAVTAVIDASTTLPLSTGLTPQSSQDQFIVIAHGAVHVVSPNPLDSGWFDPSGLIRLRRTGTVFNDMPYGCLIGHFPSSAYTGFYVGDGGCFNAQPVDLGNPFRLSLNMSAADHSSMAGSFVVSVIMLPYSTSAAPSPGEIGASLRSGPNPSGSSISVRYVIPRSGHVLLRVFDTGGRMVRSLADETLPAGEHMTVWDGLDESGARVAAGVYYFQVSHAEGTLVEKLTVLR